VRAVGNYRAFGALFTRHNSPPYRGKEITMVTVDDRRETVSLIGSDKVEGTAVYGMNGRKIGSVQR
jgi:hypothetical protein